MRFEYTDGCNKDFNPIGSASFKKYDDECAEVKRIFIKKEYRGRGISNKLMELLEDAARKKGYERFCVYEKETIMPNL